MRKMLCILFVFACCLLLPGGGMHRARAAAPAAVSLSVDRASAEQWLCERSDNSDLNMPRIPGALSAPQMHLPGSRCGHADPVRCASRCALRGVAGAWKTTSPFISTRPVVVTQVADHSVCRLRRLII